MSASSNSGPPAGKRHEAASASRWARSRWWAGHLFRAALLSGVAVSAFPPLLPEPRDLGLDAAWKTGLNEAVHQDLEFGTEVVFTYGPLGFVCHPQDVGGNLFLANVFRLLAFTLFCLSVGLNTWYCRSHLLAALYAGVIAIGGMYAFFELEVLLALLGLLTFGWLTRSWLPAVPAAFLGGMALLIKFNVGLGCLATLLVWTVLLAFGQRDWKMPRTLLLLGATYLVSFLGLFWLMGGRLGSIPDYLRYSLLIAAGYSAQMSLAGPVRDTLVVLAQLVLLGAGLLGSIRNDRRYAALGLLLLPSLFLVLKSGLVRHDESHILPLFHSLPSLAGLFLLLPRHDWEKLALSLLVLGVALLSTLGELYHRTYHDLWPQGHRHLAALKEGARERERVRVASAERTAKAALPPAVVARIGDQSADAYPADIDVIVANRLRWSPRRVFQSYSAYRPELDEVNARHYRDADRPAYVLYSSWAIDRQHPFSTDPLTWLELYRWYDVAEQLPRALLLSRRDRPRFGQLASGGEQTLGLGERWELPLAAGNHVWLQVDFQLTPWGLLRDQGYKVYPPEIKVEYATGEVRTYRLVWRNAVSGILVSDLPLDSDLQRVESLWKTGSGSPVKAITLLADPWCFRDPVTIRWSHLPRDGRQGPK